MSDQIDDDGKSSIQASDNSNTIGGDIEISGTVQVGGDVHIGHTIGYTAKQVSTLITQIQTTFQPKPFDGRCPYKGLDVFEEEDAELFFGREKLVNELVSRVKESRTVFITGPSGSGKSSLVRAGLIPALKQGVIKGSNRWLYETIKPGRDPLDALASAFSRLKSPELAKYFRENFNQPDTLHECAESTLSGRKDQRLVLFIDQFEEVFTQVGKDKAELLLNLLTRTASFENGRVIILFAMRSDFVSNCAMYPELNELLNRQFIQIGAMQPDELVSAIAQPALRVGLRIDPDLIAQIINNMQGEPGILPLMQFALKDLFDAEQAKGGIIALTLTDYLQKGGIHEALQRHADNAFSKLSKDEQELARAIFKGLIEIGRDTQDTRRIALFNELIPANRNVDDIKNTVQKLADARLITTDEQAGVDTITISHEKLIDAWPWLKKLINENRDVIALQNEITGDAKEWDEHKRDISYLYTGGRLANVHEQVEKQKLALGHLAQEFVRTGRRRQRRTQALLVTAVSMALIVAVMASVVFQKQAQENINIAKTAQAANTEAVAQKATAQANAEEAQKQTDIAHAGELSLKSVALRDKNFPTSMLLAAEAYRTYKNVQTWGTLMGNAQLNPQLLQYLPMHTDGTFSVAFSPDGKILAMGNGDHTIVLWNVRTRQFIGQPLLGHSNEVQSLAFSSDNKILASGSCGKLNEYRHCVEGEIILWDVENRKPVGEPIKEHSHFVTKLAFSQNGKILVSGGGDGKIILWDISTAPLVGLSLADIRFSDMVFSPTNNILAVSYYDNGKGSIGFWNVESRQPIGQSIMGLDSAPIISFDPDGEKLAVFNSNTITFLSMETFQPIKQSNLSEKGSIGRYVAFSPDGKILASGSWGGPITFWDLETGQLIGEGFTGHNDWTSSLAFSPDGTILASGSDFREDSVTLWKVNKNLSISQSLAGHAQSVSSIAFSPNGKMFASGSCRILDKNRNCVEGEVIVRDAVTRQLIGRLKTCHTNGVTSVVFSPNGKILASGCLGGEIILWDVPSLQPIGQPLSGRGGVVTLAFSPDGKMLASDGNDFTINLWDVSSRQPIGQPFAGHTEQVNSVAFSPDGKILASGGGNRSGNIIILWDIKTAHPIGQPLEGHGGGVSSVVFSPDGKTLASGSFRETNIILWDVLTQKPNGPGLWGMSYESGGALVQSLAFSPDGKILAAGGSNDTISLWDLETRQPIDLPLIGIPGTGRTLSFSPDGKVLASGSDDGQIILWDLDPELWLEINCERIGRNFTRTEWALYIPYKPYPADENYSTCPQWPLESEQTPMPSPKP